jgi:hypothetical protein
MNQNYYNNRYAGLFAFSRTNEYFPFEYFFNSLNYFENYEDRFQFQIIFVWIELEIMA